MRMSVNLDFYGFGGNLGPIGYNLDGWTSVQHGMWRLGAERLVGRRALELPRRAESFQLREPGRAAA